MSVIQKHVRIYGLSIGDDISLTIHRNHLFNDVVSQFRRVDVSKSFAVHFSSEPGSDIGGMKREMFCLFKESVCRQQHIFAETDYWCIMYRLLSMGTLRHWGK